MCFSVFEKKNLKIFFWHTPFMALQLSIININSEITGHKGRYFDPIKLKILHVHVYRVKLVRYGSRLFLYDSLPKYFFLWSTENTLFNVHTTPYYHVNSQTV